MTVLMPEWFSGTKTRLENHDRYSMMSRMSIVFVCQITESHLKVAKFQPAGKSRSESSGFVAHELPPQADDLAIAERLKQVLGPMGYHSHPVVMAIPRSKVTCRYLSVPSHSAQEIESIVSLQASRYLPYPQEELVTGYEVVSTDNNGYSAITLVIAHRDVINRYINIAKAANIPRFSVALTSYGLAQFLTRFGPRSRPPSIIVDIDAMHMELVIVAQGKLLFSRYFKVNAAADPRSVFIDEVAKSRDAYVKETGFKAPENIFVTGGDISARDFARALDGSAGLKAEVIACKRSDADVSFAALIGLGVENVAYSLNLLPKEMKEQGKKGLRRREYARFAVMALAALIMLGLGAFKSLNNKERYLSKLKVRLDAISAEVKPLKDIEKKLSVAAGSSSEKPGNPEAFSEIYRLIPPQMTLTDFIYEAGRELTLRGQTGQLDSVLSLVSQLEGSGVFRRFGFKVRYATKKKTSAGDTISFEIIGLRK